jgi:hypothetical protein
VLYTAPELLYQMIEPLLLYANNETSIPYNLPWAPHHLGYWPIADLPPGKQVCIKISLSISISVSFSAICSVQAVASINRLFCSLSVSFDTPHSVRVGVADCC